MTMLWLLVGCASQAERAAAVARDVDDMVRVYGPGCERLGYKADTDPWRDCVLRLASRDEIERRELMTTTCVGPRRGFVHCGAF
jgi:hypothetical protein